MTKQSNLNRKVQNVCGKKTLGDYSWEKIGGAQTLNKTKKSTKIWMSK